MAWLNYCFCACLQVRASEHYIIVLVWLQAIRFSFSKHAIGEVLILVSTTKMKKVSKTLLAFVNHN